MSYDSTNDEQRYQFKNFANDFTKHGSRSMYAYFCKAASCYELVKKEFIYLRTEKIRLGQMWEKVSCQCIFENIFVTFTREPFLYSYF